jgi:GMP synthase (glutamine-hydrolysing)
MVVQQDHEVTLGRFAGLLPEAVVVDAAHGAPDLADIDRLIVLGGRMSVLDGALHPHLDAVERLMLDAVSQDVPVLGVCLAHQQLAHVGGGLVEVGAGDAAEFGVVPVTLRSSARRDPVLGPVWARFGPEFWAPVSHSDAVRSLPDQATWLAETERCPFHACRLGSALTVQFHPEADWSLLGRWATALGVEDLAGHEAQYAAHEADLAALAETIVAAFMA